MSLIYAGNISPSNYTGLGLIIEEDVTQDYNLNVRDAIAADLASANFQEPWAGWCYWNVNLKITDFAQEQIDGYTGNPTRRRFGSVAYDFLGTQGSFEFINYLQQAFEVQGCLYHPVDYQPLVYERSAVPEPTVTNFLVVGSHLVGDQIGFSASESLKKSSKGLFGNTGFRLFLENTVKCNVCVTYFAVAQYYGSLEAGQTISWVDL